MIIDKNVTKYIVFSEDSISDALRKLSANKMRVLFAVGESGVLEGVLTDGDLRRWLARQQDFDLEKPVIHAANQDFLSLDHHTDASTIPEHFSDRIEHIPLVDAYLKLVAVATKRAPEINIDGFALNDDSPCFIIAEIGNNHNGDVELARRLIDEAAAAGANCAKFQLRDLNTLYATSKDSNDLGTEYTLDLLAKYELSDDDLFRMFDYVRDKGLIPLCTPYDPVSLEKLARYGLGAFKVASADLTNDDLLRMLAHQGKPILCSTGMSREGEIRHAVNALREEGADYVLLHCNSTYPTPFKDIQLNYIKRLQEIGGCYVGYSGHERGILVSVAAVALGAKVIEKHLTLDRNMEGRDHKVSLLPAEFAEMVQGIRDIESSLGTADVSRQMSQGELINRETLAKSLVINRDLKAGEPITSEMVEVRSPGTGLAPSKKPLLIGKIAKRDLNAGDFFHESDIEEVHAAPKNFSFRRAWGLPVRYHDMKELATLSNPDFVEFHLSYKDLTVDLESCFDGQFDVGFTVHSPELFARDHILDLSSRDEEYRKHSVGELQSVIGLARQLQGYFPATTCPLIITNVGGFTLHGHLSDREKDGLLERLEQSLKELDTEGVEIIPQTMPPYPWQFGGQRYHNLFVNPEEIAQFCERHGMRVCLDVSHSKLACNHLNWPMTDFVRKVGPYSAHLHLADASGVDGEGLQVGEGEMDFQHLREQLQEHAPEASFIPEIWQGHKNGGEGFWRSLHLLEQYAF